MRAKQWKSTILELWKPIKATEKLKIIYPRETTELWLQNGICDILTYEWNTILIHPPSPAQFHGSHKKPAVTQPMERTDLLRSSVKSNIPRAQSIFCLNLQLPGKSLFLGSFDYLIWLRVQLNRKKIPCSQGIIKIIAICWQRRSCLRLCFQLGLARDRLGIWVHLGELDNQRELWKSLAYSSSSKRLFECTTLCTCAGETREWRRS